MAQLSSASDSAHRREDARQPLGQHGLAGTRWADHQQVVTAGGSDLHRPARLLLAAHVAHVGPAGRQIVKSVAAFGVPSVPWPPQPGADLGQASRPPAHRPRGTSAASAALARGTTMRRPQRRARMRAGRTPETARTRPKAPARRGIRSRRAVRGAPAPPAARMPRAMARSNRPPSLGSSAGARFTVTGGSGIEGGVLDRHANAIARFAHRRFGQADDVDVEGRPPDRCTSTITCGAVTPSCARESE